MNDGNPVAGGGAALPGGETSPAAGASSVPHREMKQRQQIYNMLNDFERTSKFNKEQMKNFGSPKGTQAPTSVGGTGPSAKNNGAPPMVETQAAIGGKKPKIRNSNKD